MHPIASGGSSAAVGVERVVEVDGLLGAVAQEDAGGSFAVAQLQIAWRVQGDDPALAEEGDPVAELVGLLHVVGRQQHRLCVREPADQVEHLALGADIHAARRRVQRDQIGPLEIVEALPHLLDRDGYAVGGHQLLVAARLDDPAGVEHVDPAGRAHAR